MWKYHCQIPVKGKRHRKIYSNVHVITLEDVGMRVIPIPKMKAVVNQYDSNRREIGYKV